MQQATAQSGSQAATGVVVSELGEAPEIQTPEERASEELGMLFVGFGTGLTIAGVFLIYVLLEIAHLL